MVGTNNFGFAEGQIYMELAPHSSAYVVLAWPQSGYFLIFESYNRTHGQGDKLHQ